MKKKSDYLIYCDESCPLEKDGNDIMVIGAISCPYEEKQQIFSELRELKEKYNMNSRTETKWIKVSNSKLSYYKELVDYFIKKEDIRIRILVAQNKKGLDHIKFNGGNYTNWYFKMYYYLLNKFIDENYQYYMMFDQKDKYTKNSLNKVKNRLENEKTKTTLINNKFYIDIKQINSKESELMQLLDVFLGATSYRNRNLYKKTNEIKKNINGKDKVIEYIETKTKKQLNKSTSPYENKFNLFLWRPRE